MLYDNNAAAILLGCICNNPFLCISDKYTLSKDDFYNKNTGDGIRLHSIIYVVCRQLALSGVTEITDVDIQEFLKSYPVQLETFQDNNGSAFINTIKQLGTNENVEQYYDIVRKFSILRSYRDQGFDITELYDDAEDTATSRQKFNELSIDSIVTYFEDKLIKIKKAFYQDKDVTEYKMGLDLHDIVNGFEEEPMSGATTISPYLNTATRGLIKGQLTIMSIPSGNGKSCIGAATMANVCSKTIYSKADKKFIPNPYYQGEGGLYIQYEMDDRAELSPRILSTVSKVPAKHIMDGTYELGEKERVQQAVNAINDSEMYIVTMPNFTISAIENCVKEYAITKGVGYVVFDYISAMSAVNSEVQRDSRVSTREDMVLAAISSALKDMARKYNVAILTFTQTNSNINVQEILDANCIAGSRAVQNKADVGMIMCAPRAKEVPFIDMYLDKRRGFDNINVNRIIHLYKVRFGSEESGIKIWGHLDLSTGEFTDAFVTNKNNEPYQMDKTFLIG